ncbi:zinc-dependent alcohol dehydrogenase family protein [Luteimonas vadosa]|uniref:enoyl-[acyl-carrier-protein] reductase n=1 Tax=Luteimonas vadosa TaxID=1165507 RepID=A0ABP9E5V7_9GAMM
MKRVEYRRRGPVPQDVVEVVERETPAPGQGEALVEVLAAPINPSDVLTLAGDYGTLPPLPAVGGNEGVGRVVALGADAHGPGPGQMVLLPVGIGTWSTHVVAPAKALMALPEGADPVQLSMLTVNPPTARLLLTDTVELPPGSWVLQNAANSAVGGYLVQLAKARGLRTVNVVRRESAAEVVEEQGGDVVLVDGDDLAARVESATGGAAITLGIDAVGGMATERLAQSLASGATLVNYGAMGGEACAISPASLIFRGITLRGFWLSWWYKQAEPQVRAALFAELAGLIAQGQLSARVQTAYAIDDAAQAVAAAASGGRDGKVVLLPNGAIGG